MIKSGSLFLRVFLIYSMVAIFASGCTQLHSIRKENIAGNDFSTQLAKEYQQYALSDAEQHQWRDAELFAAKANKSLKGEIVLPESADDARWHLSPEQRSTLTAAREYFATILPLKNDKAHFAEVAQTQVAFDCWLEKSTESKSATQSNSCRETFFELMDRLTQHSLTQSEAPLLANAQRLEPLSSCTTVIFDFNSSQLTEQSVKTLDIFIHQLKESERDHDLYITGHADRMGSDDYNLRLSQERIDAVKNYIQNHIKVVKLRYHTKSHGENKPKLPTADHIMEPVNRRVDIGIIEPQAGHCHPLD